MTAERGGDHLWTRQVDVTDKAQLEAALADFCGDDGPDIMWNNAGIGESGWFEGRAVRPGDAKWSTSTSRRC